MQFLINIVRLSLWLSLLAAIFIPLERRGALRPSAVWRRGFGVDLVYYFVSSLLPSFLLAFPIAWIGYLSSAYLPEVWQTWSQSLPLTARFALTLFVGEIGTYWGHRWSHEVPFLWRFHAVHHSARHMDWLVNVRAHPLDMVFTRLCGILLIFALGLGHSASGTTLAMLTTLITTFWGFFIHSNLRWRFGRLEQLVATPGFHHWHHTRKGAIDRNYAATFPFVDRLFGTLYLPKAWPTDYGTEADLPDDIVGQLVEPFMRARPAPGRAIGPTGAPPDRVRAN